MKVTILGKLNLSSLEIVQNQSQRIANIHISIHHVVVFIGIAHNFTFQLTTLSNNNGIIAYVDYFANVP